MVKAQNTVDNSNGTGRSKVLEAQNRTEGRRLNRMEWESGKGWGFRRAAWNIVKRPAQRNGKARGLGTAR